MTQRYDLKEISRVLNWRLLVGGHDFPGPDGGTCINEAAIVVAGFEYRRVNRASDCPSCFSRSIAAYALRLNDLMPDDLRQELLVPFVTHLAGTADSNKIERARVDLMAIRTVTDVLPSALRFHKLESHAVYCERITTRTEARAAANRAVQLLQADVANLAAVSAANNTFYAAAYAATPPEDDKYYERAVIAAAEAAADVVAAAATAATAAMLGAASYDARRAVWIKGVAILDAALKIGNRTDPIETSTIISRIEDAKRDCLLEKT